VTDLSTHTPALAPLNAIPNEAHASGLSWPSVIGGALLTAALSLVLLALGLGFDLSAIPAWADVDRSALAVGTGAIVWLVATQIIASTAGGYLAGRLRTKWARIHSDEVYFRDTAHGFLAWALATVLTAAFLTSATAAVLGGLPGAGGTLEMASRNHDVDALFRSDRTIATPVEPAVKAEATELFARTVTGAEGSAADAAYLAQLVASRTGLTAAQAQARVADISADARASADAARRNSARASLWLFVAWLAGAFSASFAATIGGRQRDHVVVV
jgi:hypothetical protein